MAMDLYCSQIFWIKQKLRDIKVSLDHISIKCDNTSVINLTKKQICNGLVLLLLIQFNMRCPFKENEVIFPHYKYNLTLGVWM